MRTTRHLASLVSMALLTAGAAATARAAVRDSVTMPDQLTIGGHRLVLNGLGTRRATAFKVPVYVAGLYVAERSGNAAALLEAPTPKVMVLRFVRSVDRDDITKAWTEGFAKNAHAGIPSLDNRIARLNGLMPDIHDGDTLRSPGSPAAGPASRSTGRPRGVVGGDDFGRALFSVWLGPSPPNRDLQEGLLGTESK